MERFQVNTRFLEKVKKNLRDRTRRVWPHRIAVGINAKDGAQPKVDYHGKDTEATLAQVLKWMEFGTDTVPERPIMRIWFDANETRLRREMTAATRREYMGKKEAVHELGEKWAEELREYYLAGAAPVDELATSTIGAKAAAGLSHPEIPVVATRQLVDAIGWKERRR
jgi:hypothetical protein